ncbi:MAG: hypothetical protein B7O98_07465 [Zestosphaera tikiterensis]|uniref:Sodium:solute symporter n=1 Tax=Zestosphaera tikiterensis TaxID=1973259 RepID=A0A2R7Y4S7_9CREN|nr:MAG: hypothetical protein B7O98_07465 [Zestosphaera tikiterensis]
MEAWQVTLTVMFVYIIFMIVLGYLAGRKFRKTLEDFYVLSRTAGFIVVFLAIASTYHSAFAFLTSVATYATTGVTWWIGAMPWTTLAAVFGYYYGKRIFKLGKAKKFITPADLLADFYGGNAIRVITAVIQAIFVIAYIVVQAVGLGIVFDIGSGGVIPYTYGSLILIMVTCLYLILGDLRAAYWTDVAQGIWMYVGVWAAGLYLLYKFFPGGVAEVFTAARAVNPALLTLQWKPEMLLGSILIYSFGLMVLPHLLIKYYASKDVWTIKWSSVGTALYLSSFYIPTLFVGLGAAVLNAKGIPGILEAGFIKALQTKYGSADAVMAYMIYNFTPPIFAGFLLAGAAAAAMSTLDSFLGATSMILTRDIYQRYVRPKASESELIIVSRVLLLAFALIGWYLALLKPGLIFDITSIAVAGGLQFVPAIIQAVLPTRRNYINREGAIAGILAGSIVVMLLTQQTGKYFGIPPTYLYHAAIAALIGLAVNLVVTFLVRALTKPLPEDKIREYAEILKS